MHGLEVPLQVYGGGSLLRRVLNSAQILSVTPRNSRRFSSGLKTAYGIRRI